MDYSLFVQDTNGALSGLDRHAVTLLAAKPDVVVAVTTALASAAVKASGTVPVVFTGVSDPVRSGLIDSYAASKTNATGITSYAGPLSGKRLELLQEVAPRIKNVLAVVSANEIIAQDSIRFLKEAAAKLKLKVVRRDASTAEEIEKSLTDTPKGAVDAIYHVPSTLVGSHIQLLINKANADKLPLVAHEAQMAERGVLLTYGGDLRLAGAQAARLVVKILKGDKPADIPSETPGKFLLVLNMTAAKTIGLKIPRKFVDRVDRLVE